MYRIHNKSGSIFTTVIKSNGGNLFEVCIKPHGSLDSEEITPQMKYAEENHRFIRIEEITISSTEDAVNPGNDTGSVVSETIEVSKSEEPRRRNRKKKVEEFQPDPVEEVKESTDEVNTEETTETEKENVEEGKEENK